MGRVVVLGAGYAGVMAANRLAGRGERVTVVNPAAHLVERIRLHRVAAGQRDSARVPLADLLHRDVELVLDRAERIDADAATVVLASGDALTYDRLVFAIGSGAPVTPSADSRVHRVGSEEEALRLRDVLRARPDAPVTVVGCGLTGVEVAAVLADRPAGVRVLTTSPMTARAAERAHVARLRSLGVTVETGVRADLTALAEAGGVVVDTTGFRVPTLARDSGLTTDAVGRLVVGPDLTVAGHPEIVGAGDGVVVEAPGAAHLRMACATALPMGAHAADVVAAGRRGEQAPNFRLGYVAQCSDLGGAVGRVQLVRADDAERPLALTGLLGGFGKEQVCRMTLRWLRQERVRAGRFRWSRGGAADRTRTAVPTARRS